MFKMWNNMFDGNESMKTWSDNMKKVYETGNLNQAGNFWSDSFEKAYGEKDEIFKAWTDSFGKMYGSNEWTKTFGNGMFNLNEQKDVFKKLFGSMEVYGSLFDFWTKINQNAPYDSPEKVVEFCKNYRDSYMTTVGNIMKTSAMGEYAPFVDQYMEVYKSYITLFDKANTPWLDTSDELQGLYKNMMSGDTSAMKEYYTIVNETYKKSFAPFMNMSGLGIYKDNIEAQMQGADSYVQFINIYNELMSLVYNVFSESMEDVTKKYASLTNEDKQPKTFKEFYDLWLNINESSLVNLFGTEEFSKAYCGVAEKYCDFKLKFDKLAGLYLKVLPLPSKEDMDSLYKTAYNQKKEIKALKIEVANLRSASEEIDTLRKEMGKLSDLQKEFAEFKKSMSKKVEV